MFRIFLVCLFTVGCGRGCSETSAGPAADPSSGASSLRPTDPSPSSGGPTRSWVVDLGHRAERFAAAGGRLFAAGGGLSAVEAGKVVWTKPIPATWVAVAHGRVVVGTKKALHRFDPDGGVIDEREIRVDGRVLEPFAAIADGDALLVATDHGLTRLVGTGSDTLQTDEPWSVSGVFPDALHWGPAGRLWVTAGTRVIVLNRAGSRLFEVDAQHLMSGPGFGPDGRVGVVTDDTLRIADTARCTGGIAGCRFDPVETTERVEHWPPAFLDDVVLFSSAGQLVGLRAGQQVFAIRFNQQGAPLPYDGDVLAFGGGFGGESPELRRVTKDGKTVWRKVITELGTGFFTDPYLFVSEGTVFLGFGDRVAGVETAGM